MSESARGDRLSKPADSPSKMLQRTADASLKQKLREREDKSSSIQLRQPITVKYSELRARTLKRLEFYLTQYRARKSSLSKYRTYVMDVRKEIERHLRSTTRDDDKARFTKLLKLIDSFVTEID